MDDVLKFQKFLIKDYYKDFVCSLDLEKVDLKRYTNIVYYRGEYNYELNYQDITDRINEILLDAKEVYLSALGEILSKLSSLDSLESKLEYLKYTIQLYKIPIKQLQHDMLLNDIKSRYYVDTDMYNGLFSFLNLEAKARSILGEESSFFEMYLVEMLNDRMKIVARLPFSLFTIAGVFVNILQKKQNEIEEQLFLSSKDNSKLTWVGKPSHLGFIIGTLADLGYIDVSKNAGGDINYTHFSKKVHNTFNIKSTPGTLSKYLNISTEKSQETLRKFKKEGFDIPHKGRVS